uniref:VWFA domain-containing protein n=1 Tax=Leersia perrieri TaxID=77586 RepID=A0A0D9XVE7_9ORYZ
MHTQVTSSVPVKVSTTPIFPMIQRGHAKNKDIQVLLRVEAPPAAYLKGRVPIDLVVVIDVSGSMNDPAAAAAWPDNNKLPSRLDLLKEAMKFIVRKLDDGDRLSIVPFNDRVIKEYSTGLLEISGNGRSIAGKKVDRLEAHGGTALLMPGLDEAVKVLDSRPGNSQKRVGFIVLLTDGDHTRNGFQWSRELIRGVVSKYPVHTFGLGAAHDQEALLYIAQESRGTYSFVDDENLDKIAGALAVCLVGLKTVATVDTRVSLKVTDQLSGARIERIDSGGYESRIACGGIAGEVVIGVLYAGEVKSFVVHMNVGHHCQLNVVCSYTDPDTTGSVSVEAQRPEEAVFVVDGVHLPSPVVLQHMVHFELLEMIAGFVQSEISLQKTMTMTAKQLRGNVLQSKWEEFRRARQFWGGVKLDGVEKEVNAMVISLRSGLAYVCSWVSSHHMQRATAMGSPDKVAAEFTSPEMVTMLEEARKVMTAGAVKVSTAPIFSMIPRDQTNKDFQLLLRVEAPPAVDLKGRVPIDLVAVVDVSGSMNELAATSSQSWLDVLKDAMKFIIRKLDDGDRLSIVAFNDQPVKEYSTGLLDISGDGLSIAGRKVDRLKARRGTALMPGLEEAVKILDGRPADSQSHVGFIVLITDGADTSGFQWSREAIHGGAISKYPVHAFGLGTAHDPEALLCIAQESRGTYSFVDDENLDKIADALAVCLGWLKTVAAVDTRVSLKVAEFSGARIERIDSGGYKSRVACDGASGEVVVGVLYAGEVKSFVVHLHVPAAASLSSSVEQRLITVGGWYAHAPGAGAVCIEEHGVFVKRPDQEAAIVVAPSPIVLKHMVRFKLLEIIAGFVEGEIILEEKTATAMKQLHCLVLQRMWEDSKRAGQFWGGAKLGGIKEEVDALVSSLRKGLAYVCSWVSSHQMQRATAMGSPEPDKVVAAEFMTPAMATMHAEGGAEASFSG